jgi:DNA-binding NtrC family response regulator
MSKKRGKILIIDDNMELLLALKMFLSPHFEIIKTEKNPNMIPEHLRKDNYDVILLDMNFSAGVVSGNEGIFWMNKILESDSTATIILITAFGDVELAVKAMKEGATDFILKSWDEEIILSTILAAYSHKLSKLEIRKLRNKQKHLSEKINQDYLICKGESEAMKRIFEMIEKVAATDANVLILGENGTGKELIAREIHRLSDRSDEIFVSLDVGTLPETLFESEMFGHVKGAFTDAKMDKPGRFELASNGTLFLDEIGNIPLTQQSKLLSALQKREVTRIGSNYSVPVDIRLICATNKPIYSLVKQGVFREDLLYRINTIQIELPALRERLEDIEVLANSFLSIFKNKYFKTGLTLSRSAVDKLKRHHWPGNVRELKHIIEKAVILSDGSILTPEDFSFHSKSKKNNHPETLNLAENEKYLITIALETSEGNISEAAGKLGINRSTLYEKIRKYEIKPL